MAGSSCTFAFATADGESVTSSVYERSYCGDGCVEDSDYLLLLAGLCDGGMCSDGKQCVGWNFYQGTSKVIFKSDATLTATGSSTSFYSSLGNTHTMPTCSPSSSCAELSINNVHE